MGRLMQGKTCAVTLRARAGYWGYHAGMRPRLQLRLWILNAVKPFRDTGESYL